MTSTATELTLHFAYLAAIDLIRKNVWKNDFFVRLMSRTDSEPAFKAVLSNRQDLIWGQMGERAFLVFFRNPMYSEVYNFLPGVQARQVKDNHDVMKVTNELSELILVGRSKYGLDIRNELKRALYPYVLNSFVIRMSGVVLADKALGRELRDRFVKDFDYLMDFFCVQISKSAEEGPAKAFQRFKQLYFLEKEFPDDSKDKLKHFVYKLRFKK